MRLVTFVGFIGSVVTIFVYLTGWASLKDTIGSYAAFSMGAASGNSVPPEAVVLESSVDGFDTTPKALLQASDGYPFWRKIQEDLLSPNKSARCRESRELCVAEALRKHGASERTIITSAFLDGAFFTEISERGLVDVAASINPIRVNGNDELWLVNGTPLIIPAAITEEEIASALSYMALLKRKFNPAAAFPTLDFSGQRKLESTIFVPHGAPRFLGVRALNDGHVMYEFRDWFASECFACELVGQIDYGFEFDGIGRALRKTALRILPASSRDYSPPFSD